MSLQLPHELYNSLTEAPFSQCSICKTKLTAEGPEYLIEKTFRRFPEEGGEELLAEIAVCLPCTHSMQGRLSKESRDRMYNYFREKAIDRAPEYRSTNQLLNECFLSGKPREDTDFYQLFAHCRGAEISPRGSFFMLSDEILEEMQELMSAQTRDELRGFADDHFGPPPELEALFRGPHLVGI